ncbi:hypothetical protein D3C76_939540 [compost metagenome]
MNDIRPGTEQQIFRSAVGQEGIGRYCLEQGFIERFEPLRLLDVEQKMRPENAKVSDLGLTVFIEYGLA